VHPLGDEDALDGEQWHARDRSGLSYQRTPLCDKDVLDGDVDVLDGDVDALGDADDALGDGDALGDAVGDEGALDDAAAGDADDAAGDEDALGDVALAKSDQILVEVVVVEGAARSLDPFLVVAGAQMGVAQDSNAPLHSGAIDAASPEHYAASSRHRAAQLLLHCAPLLVQRRTGQLRAERPVGPPQPVLHDVPHLRYDSASRRTWLREVFAEQSRSPFGGELWPEHRPHQSRFE